MSDKARRSKAWDDAFFPPWAWPAKALLRAFSSIPLAVSFLVGVSLFGISASVPIGMLALTPTYLFYAACFVVLLAIVAGIPVLAARRMMRGAPKPRRFIVSFFLGLGLAAVAVVFWQRSIWPALHWNPITNEGVRFFADFCDTYKSTTLRRLPGLEMSELQYYAWWPMPTMLGLFVVNLVIATVRRIEFNFKNIGVLTVHTGIVVIALGSVYYNGLKLEGDTLLMAGQPDPNTGMPRVGPPQFVFYDNTDVALYVDVGRGMEQRLLHGVPRYNDYNLNALGPNTAWVKSGRVQPWTTNEEGKPLPPRTLSIDAPAPPIGYGTVDQDLKFRIIGYAAYAEQVFDWVLTDDRTTPNSPPTAPTTPTTPPTADEGPLRLVYLHSGVPDAEGLSDYTKPAFAFTLAPGTPADRIAASMDPENKPVLSIEYTLGPSMGMTEERWRDLTEEVPEGTKHALIIEFLNEGGTPERHVVPIRPQKSFDLGAYKFDVTEVSSTPTFPIITKGFENSSSAMAVVRITKPDGNQFERWVYARFPQINQDLSLTAVNASGMPNRGAPDPAVRVALIETDHLAVHIDEPTPGVTRAAIRLPDGTVSVRNALEPAREDETTLGGEWLHDLVGPGAKLGLRVGDRWDRAIKVDRPAQVAKQDRQNQFVGTHDKAMVAVEVRIESGPPGPDDAEFRRVVWVPFSKYMGEGLGNLREVGLPEGRFVRIGFGRQQHVFPNFAIQLVDFQMLAYDHRGAPRDYQSIIRVTPTDDSFDLYEHVTKLNAPLMAPFHWSEERVWIANLAGRLASGLSPHQFKLSQAGWDRTGWDESQRMADQGLVPRPFAKFTILGVGNNPGIHVIALGAVLMAIGVPWAFYVKPWLVRRESARIRAAVAAGTWKKPGTRDTARPATPPITPAVTPATTPASSQPSTSANEPQLASARQSHTTNAGGNA